MKLKYLAMLAAASIVSLGMVTGCNNPCAAKEGDVVEEEVIEEKVDPCAAPAEGCAGK